MNQFCNVKENHIVLTVIAAILFGLLVFKIGSNIVWATFLVVFLLGVLSIWVPVIIFISFIFATLIIPNEILPALSGHIEPFGFGVLKLHPAGVAVFLGSFFNLVANRNKFIQKIQLSRPIRIMLAFFSFFILSSFIQTVFFRGIRGIPYCLETYLFSFTFFLYLLIIDTRKMCFFVKSYTFIIIILALVGIVEYYAGRNFIYEKTYLKTSLYWYQSLSDAGYRITTTIGHSLKNATYLLFALPLALVLFKKPWRYISTFLVLIAIFCTGSRVAAFLAVLFFVSYYIKLDFDLFKQIKTTLAIIASLLISYCLVFYTQIGSTLMNRIFGAKDSIIVRMYSLNEFFNLAKKSFFIGKGMELSFEESKNLFGKVISFENPWLMLVVDVGFITTLLYITTLTIGFFANFNKMHQNGLPRAIIFSFIMVMIMVSSFSSFGFRNTLNMLVFFNLAALFHNFENGSKVIKIETL